MPAESDNKPNLGTFGREAIGLMLNIRPGIPTHAAILENVALLTRENLGREPPENVCRFARENVLTEGTTIGGKRCTRR